MVVNTGPCPICGRRGQVKLTEDQGKRYSKWLMGGLIQDYLSDVDPGLREQLMNGVHNECFEMAFRP